MKDYVHESAAWIYSGVWGVLTRWFQVPDRPPVLPALEGEEIKSFRPAEGYLRYLKFQFWFGLLIIDGLILIGEVVLLIAAPVVGILAFIPMLAIAVLPDIVVYIAIHLRYDTTWYVLSNRSMRLRRGIWTINETTITYENIQNVSLRQGPLQRIFGISDVVVDTAGGGGVVANAHGQVGESLHRGVIEGIANAPEVRDAIQQRLRRSRSAGLGDDLSPAPAAAGMWTDAHIAALRDIRVAIGELVKHKGV